MPDTPPIQNFQELVAKLGDGLNYTFVLAFLINIFLTGAGSFEYYVSMINSLQIILHLPMLRIIIPSNVASFF